MKTFWNFLVKYKNNTNYTKQQSTIKIVDAKMMDVQSGPEMPLWISYKYKMLPRVKCNITANP